VIPGQIKDEQIFHPIEPGFKQYPSSAFEFVVGSAEGVDTSAKTARVATSTGDVRTLAYDYLVVATGARATNPDAPWKAASTYEAAVELLHKTAERVAAAQHVVVAGAGPTGCETSAEIRYEYKDAKQVVLLSADPEILGGDSIASSVEREITKLGVEVRKNARVTGTKALPDGRTEVQLADGTSIATDLYLPTMGLTPNTEFLDPALLNERRYVDVDECFRVGAAPGDDGKPKAENVWACGDVVSIPRAGFMISDKQAAGVAKNVELALQGKPQLPVKGMPVDIFVCATGRSRGAGRIGYFRVPSLMVWGVKVRTLGLDMAPKYVSGAQW
jgi:NADH dehydrogenase FAD-containing subunit